MKEVHIEYWMQTKEGWSVELKSIATHNLGYSVRPITKRAKLLMGPCKAFILQMQPNFVAHLKLMWYSMLIMALLVLGIGFLQNIMKLLLNVLDSLKKFGFLIFLGLSMGGLFMCNGNG